MRISACLLALSVLVLAGAVEAACPVDGATYALRESPEFTATFRQVPGTPSAHGLILDVHSAKTGRTFSFTINRGNGFGEATLWPTTGELSGTVEIYTVDDNGAFTDYFGDAEQPAPGQLLVPKLGPALWNQIAGLTGGEAERERMPRAFFDRVACGAISP